MIEFEKFLERLNTTTEKERTQEHREEKKKKKKKEKEKEKEEITSLIDFIGDFLSETSKLFSLGLKVHKVNRERYHSAV